MARGGNKIKLKPGLKLLLSCLLHFYLAIFLYSRYTTLYIVICDFILVFFPSRWPHLLIERIHSALLEWVVSKSEKQHLAI